jgi:glycosyltransferase involved in cell wall biosynthesis
VRDGIDGWVISPYEEEAWIEKIRHLSQSPNILKEIGQSAQQRAQEFEFEEVANQRAKLILKNL